MRNKADPGWRVKAIVGLAFIFAYKLPSPQNKKENKLSVLSLFTDGSA